MTRASQINLQGDGTGFRRVKMFTFFTLFSLLADNRPFLRTGGQLAELAHLVL